MINLNKFPCTSCGVCCQSISNIKELRDFDLGNGICKHLDSSTNLCRIYEIRPNICRVDIMYEKEYHKYYNEKDFYKLNAKACNLLQEKFKVDLKYRVEF